MKKMFRSTGSYEPDQLNRDSIDLSNRFRSTGSYEPDHQVAASRNFHCSFDPQALTSLTNAVIACSASSWLFRSTGSYEPDQYVAAGNETHYSFDPQALTSLTMLLATRVELQESFDPQALTSLTIYWQ